MYESICYKKPFLKEVIFKVDFSSPIQSVEKGLSTKLTKAILSKFPISEPQKAHSQEFLFTGADIHAKSTETMQWVYHGKSREKTMIVTPDAVSYVSRAYSSFENLVDDVEGVLTILFEEIKDIASSRVGLRYINIIDINDEENPLKWEKYINESILGIIDFNEEKQYLTRAFHILEYNFDVLSVKYQFGIANPDFPAVIRKKQFVIDINAYSHGVLELVDIKSFLSDGHNKIQDIFEKSITDATRNLMKLQNG